MLDCQDFGNTYMLLMKAYGKATATPTSATFELTPLCNFNCPMCYVHKKRTPEVEAQMLSTGQWLDLARQARDMGVLHLKLTGGEVFTRPDFWEIYSEINKMGFLVHLLSNGYLIDEKVIEKFNKYGAPFTMKLSLYGASNETYEKMCGVKDGFDRFSHAVDLLKESNIPFNVTSTVIKENISDIHKMYEFAAVKDFEFEHTIAVIKSARNADSSPEKFRYFIKDFENNLTYESIKKFKFSKNENPFSICRSYKNSFLITWNGLIQGCSFMSDPSFNVTNGSLFHAWKKLIDALGSIKFPPKCQNCKYREFCQSCPGTRFSETGCHHKEVKHFCDDAKLLYNIYNQYNRKDE